MKKILLAIIATITLIPLTASAKTLTEDELNTILDSIYAEEEINFNIISPANINDETSREEYTRLLNSYIWSLNSSKLRVETDKYLDIKISDDYKSLFLEDRSDLQTINKSKTKKINWANYDENKLNEVLDFTNKNKRKILNDIEYIIENVRYNTYTNEGKEKYLDDINNNANIKFKIFEQGGGFGGPFFMMLNRLNSNADVICILYNDTIYYCIETESMIEKPSNFGLYDYPVLYIPSNTEENIDSYIETAAQIIKEYFKDAHIVNYPVEAAAEDIYNEIMQLYPDHVITDNEKENITTDKREYRISRLNYGYENGYIDRGLNESFEPVVAKVTIGNKSIELMIAKGTDNQKSNELPEKIKNEYKAQATNDINNVQESESNSTEQNNNNITNDDSKTLGTTSGTVSNPKTGNSPTSLLLLFGIIGIPGLLFILKNKTKYSKI